MNNHLEYKGYYGSVQCDIDSNVIFGKLEWINDLVTYEADTISEIKRAFEESVDEYIVFCQEKGKEPERAFKGSFNVRISPANHRKAAIAAYKLGMNLNQFVEMSIVEKISNCSEDVHQANELLVV